MSSSPSVQAIVAIGSIEMGGHLSIGELAKETGVKVVTIRYYEQIGVLPAPARTASNYRIYSREHQRRLRFIRRCRDLGLSLHQIRDLLRLSSKNAPSCAEICRMAQQHLQAVESKLADLKRLASELRRISASCTGNRPTAECRIIEALSREREDSKLRGRADSPCSCDIANVPARKNS